jgi:hypothetical protein
MLQKAGCITFFHAERSNNLFEIGTFLSFNLGVDINVWILHIENLGSPGANRPVISIGFRAKPDKHLLLGHITRVDKIHVTV